MKNAAPILFAAMLAATALADKPARSAAERRAEHLQMKQAVERLNEAQESELRKMQCQILAERLRDERAARESRDPHARRVEILQKMKGLGC